MSHTCLSPVFLSIIRLLVVSESIAEVPHRQVAKRPNRLFLILILILIIIIVSFTGLPRYSVKQLQ